MQVSHLEPAKYCKGWWVRYVDNCKQLYNALIIKHNDHKGAKGYDVILTSGTISDKEKQFIIREFKNLRPTLSGILTRRLGFKRMRALKQLFDRRKG